MFYERIKELRNSLGINQIEFGKKLGVTKQCVSNWENGSIQPSVDMLIKICKVFSISSDYLIGLNSELTVDVSGLNSEQIILIQNIVNNIKSAF